MIHEESRQKHLVRLKAYNSSEKGKAAKKRYKDKIKASKPVTVKSPKVPKIKSQEQIELEKQKAKALRRKYHERTYVKKGYNRTDPATKKMARNIRKRLKKQLDKGLTIGPTIAMLGCSVAEFRAYIEAQFTQDMSWDNYGTVWHLDHIKPVCSFDLSLEGIAKEVNHYSNLRPLLAEDNLAKSKIDVTLKFKKSL